MKNIMFKSKEQFEEFFSIEYAYIYNNYIFYDPDNVNIRYTLDEFRDLAEKVGYENVGYSRDKIFIKISSLYKINNFSINCLSIKIENDYIVIESE